MNFYLNLEFLNDLMKLIEHNEIVWKQFNYEFMTGIFVNAGCKYYG